MKCEACSDWSAPESQTHRKCYFSSVRPND